MKKLVMVIPNLGGGGAEKVFAELAVRLSENWDIDVIIFENGGIYESRLLKAGIRIHCVYDHPPLPVFLFKLGLLIRKLQPDIVMSFLVYTSLVVWLSTMGSNIKIAISARNNFRAQINCGTISRLKAKLLERIYHSQRVSSIIAVSNGIAEMIIEEYGLSSDKVVSISNGLDLENLSRLSKEEVMDFDNCVFQSPTIVASGRLTPQKNLALLLHSFVDILASYPSAKLLILGDGEEKAQLKRLSFDLKISQAVVWGGFRKNPHAIISQATVYVMSSDYEGFPNSLAEAMWTNGCCVSTNCLTGPSEIIIDGESGFLTSPNNSRELSDKIKNLLGSDALRAKVRDKARTWAKSQSADIMVQKFNATLLASISGSKA